MIASRGHHSLTRTQGGAKIGGPRLRSEDIYEAIVDDTAFAALPSAIAASCGARSCNVFWIHGDGDAAMMGHSGYYTDEQLLNYTTNFTGADLWATEAMRKDRINKVWNCDDLVSGRQYESSIFYNEWIRQMGDDCFHCMGTVMQTRWGAGVIGLHRGRTQGPFGEELLRVLQGNMIHLRRMLTIRGRLSAGLKRVQHAEAVLDALGYPLISVTAKGRVTYANAPAEALIRRDDGLKVVRGVLTAGASAAERALKAALTLATSSVQPLANAVSVPRSDGGRYDLTLVPLIGASGSRTVLVTISDCSHNDSTLVQRLRALYALTDAEAEIAVGLSQGATAAEIAEARSVSVGTVRGQIKSISAKLGCHRQTGIVSLVKSLPPLNR